MLIWEGIERRWDKLLDTSIVINLDKNLEGLKRYKKTEEVKNDTKESFKEYLTKEVNNKSDNKNFSSEISEKNEKKLNNEDLKTDTNEEDLEELLYLVLNLLGRNLDTSAEINNLNIQDSSYLEDINTLINLPMVETNEVNSATNENSEVVENINELIKEILSANNTTKETGKELLEEIKKLVEIMPEDSIKKVENNLESNISKDILNTLILKANEETDISYKKDINSITEADEKTDNSINVTDKVEKIEAVEGFDEGINKENLSGEKTSKDKSIDKKEEKILMKFLEDDSSENFSRTTNYYESLSKIPSNTEIIDKPISISRETINLDIIKNVKYMVKNAVEELKVKIFPKELGEMTIKILSEEGIMKAEIKSTSKETYNLLNSNLNEIKKVLENQNIRIQEVNIGIYNEDTTFFSGNGSSRENLREFNDRKEEGLAYEENESLENFSIESNVNLLA